MLWTDMELARIAQMWPDYSAKEIGDKLGRSRNAVIGIVHRSRARLKLKHKSSAVIRRKPRATAKPLPPPRVRNCDTRRRKRANMPVQCPCQLIELDAINCHWPYGDPHAPGFYFCGALVVEGRRYCMVHLRAAHHPEPATKPGQRACYPTTI